MAAAAVKANIPSPAPKESAAFVSSLKLCLAAAAYDVSVQYSRAPAEARATVDVPKENGSLFEPNAIVRYFAAVGRKAWRGSPADTAKLAALLEYEENVLSQKGGDEALGLAEGLIAKAELKATTPPSPADVVLFSTLYDHGAAAKEDVYPALVAWFKEVLGTSWAKAGIEAATAQTSTKPVTVSVGGPAPAAPDQPRVQKVKAGRAMKVPKVGEEILPVPGEKNILITSALPYVNNVPHLGNIIGSVLSADAYSRYCKARNYNTVYICGTDEYGTATETRALEEGVTPRQLCDKYNAIHDDIYQWFDIGFDHFGRTTTEAQTTIAQDIFLKLDKNNLLVEEPMVQLYCEKHDGFLADRFVEGTCPKCNYEDARGDQCDGCGQLLDPFELINPRCKIDNHTPIKRESKHIFLELDKLQPEIEEWAKKASENGNWSRNGRVITDNWLKQGLKKRCITRDLSWGTPVPKVGYEKKAMYVWFDACIGYVSITANYTKQWEKWWRAGGSGSDVKLYQFMGKDNVPFHSVIFPGSQLGTRDGNWTMLHHLSTAEYLQYEGGKFSKSRGVGVFGNNARDTGVAPSVWRYYLLSNRPETSDSQFAWKDFVAKNNTELLANLGNFVNRIIKFVNAKYGGVIPDYAIPAEFGAYKAIVNGLLAQYIEDLEAVHIKSGLERLMAISAEGNRFLQDNKLDNNLFANHPAKAAAVVGYGLNLIYLISALAYPYMPATAISIVQQLNAPLRSIPDQWEPEDLEPGHGIGKAAYLFSRIEEKQEKMWRERYAGKQEQAEADTKEKKKKGKKGAQQQGAKKEQVPGNEQNQAGGMAASA